LAATYRQKVADLHEALQRERSRDEAAEILGNLIEGDHHHARELRLDLKRELAGYCAWLRAAKSPSREATGLSKLS
jgi:hypothetical protein